LVREEDILPIRPDFKPHKDNAVLVGTFFGGPLVTGYLTSLQWAKILAALLAYALFRRADQNSAFSYQPLLGHAPAK
jgi:hypothetical protein